MKPVLRRVTFEIENDYFEKTIVPYVEMKKGQIPKMNLSEVIAVAVKDFFARIDDGR